MKLDEEKRIRITLNVSECTEGYYLRWINKLGEWCYYLFNGNKSLQVNNGDVKIAYFLETVYFTDGYHPGTTYYQEKDIQESIRLYASLIDEDIYNLLTSLPQSIHVDLFCGYDENNVEKWKGVNITQGTFMEIEEHLRDFECMMLLPQSFNQSI